MSYGRLPGLNVLYLTFTAAHGLVAQASWLLISTDFPAVLPYISSLSFFFPFARSLIIHKMNPSPWSSDPRTPRVTSPEAWRSHIFPGSAWEAQLRAPREQVLPPHRPADSQECTASIRNRCRVLHKAFPQAFLPVGPDTPTFMGS